MLALDFKDRTYDEVKDLMQKELDEYKAYVDTINDPQALEEEEKKIMTEQDEVDNYIKDVKYVLGQGVDWDGEHYSKNDIAAKVIYFLNKNEVEWSYTLGLYHMVKMWKNKDFSEIEYAAFDSTMRLLNQVRFKGFQEWKDILIVNEFMKCCHERYSVDTSMMVFLARKHSTILDRAELIAKVSGESVPIPGDETLIATELE